MSQKPVSTISINTSIKPHDQLLHYGSTSRQPHSHHSEYNLSQDRIPDGSDPATHVINLGNQQTGRETSHTRTPPLNNISVQDEIVLRQAATIASEEDKWRYNFISHMDSGNTGTPTIKVGETYKVSNRQADSKEGEPKDMLSFEPEEAWNLVSQRGEKGGVSLLDHEEASAVTLDDNVTGTSSRSITDTTPSRFYAGNETRFHAREEVIFDIDNPDSRMGNFQAQGLDGGDNRLRDRTFGNFQVSSSEDHEDRRETVDGNGYNLPNEQRGQGRVIEGLYDHPIPIKEGGRSRGGEMLKTYFSGVEERRKKESFWDDSSDDKGSEDGDIDFDIGEVRRDMYHPKPTQAQMAEKLSQAVPDLDDKVKGWFSSQVSGEDSPQVSGGFAGFGGTEGIAPPESFDRRVQESDMDSGPTIFTNPGNIDLKWHKPQPPNLEQASTIDQGFYQTQQTLLNRLCSHRQAQNHINNEAESSSQATRLPEFRIPAHDPDERNRLEEIREEIRQEVERLKQQRREAPHPPKDGNLVIENPETATVGPEKNVKPKSFSFNPAAPVFQSQFEPNFNPAAVFYPIFSFEGSKSGTSQGLLPQRTNERVHPDITSPYKTSNTITPPTNKTDDLINFDLIDITPKRNSHTSKQIQETYTTLETERGLEQYDDEDEARVGLGYGGFIPESYSSVPPPGVFAPDTRAPLHVSLLRRGVRGGINRRESGRGGHVSRVDESTIERQSIFGQRPTEMVGHMSHEHPNRPGLGWERGCGRGGGGGAAPRRILQPGVPMSLDSFVRPGHAQDQETNDEKEDTKQTLDKITDGYQSATSYIILLAFDLGAEYEDVHQLYARRYGGDNHDHEAIQKAVLCDVKGFIMVLVKSAATSTDSVQEGINGNEDPIIEMAKFLQKLRKGAKQFFTRSKLRIPRTSKLRLRYKINHNFNKKLSRAERSTAAELAILESGFESLELARSYCYDDEQQRLMCEVYNDILELDKRMEVLRKATGDVLKRMIKHRIWIAKLADGGEDDMTAAEEVDDMDDMEWEIRKRGGALEWSVDEAISVARKGGGALAVGFIDSEDEDGEEEEIGEGDDYW
ncbi:hypothetical protein AA313_de0204758 [Arthrobotrys entomopaga]|nr:hypothetical protein AA313_de0204758 [Arthrobotrys entomopaga]